MAMGECLVCREFRPIVAHGVCDRCRKRQERSEQRQLYQSAATISEDAAYTALGALYKILNKLKVTGSVKREVMRLVLPFSGLSPKIQAAHLETLMAQETITVPEPGDAWDVHPGSSTAPDPPDSNGREVDNNDDDDDNDNDND